MPIVLREQGYAFGFFASDANEPPHVHVKKDGKHAKVWLGPGVRLAFNRGFKQHEMNQILRIVQANRTFLLESWNEFFGR
jgi:hypothetical protein